MESDGGYAIIIYTLRVREDAEAELERRLFKEGRKRRLEVERFPSYLELKLDSARVTVEANEIELLAGLSLQRYADEATRALDGTSLQSLMRLLGSPEVLGLVTVKRDARGARSTSLNAQRGRRSPAVFERWSIERGLFHVGSEPLTGCDRWRGTVGNESIELCVAGDGISASTTESRFDDSRCRGSR
ncbi:hypothetical protein [Polyangium aurulentum]|uniref:hypothetical protein n=1 Tax=Polyangium aurulentum TaxID=2567896 RepID=UPI0010AE812F|nr:hypothetical protein [Polyangium aurulentum]UQA56996.1 hypothetical protein E8A73_037750 [Polyangium aurulentum]